MNYKEYNEKIEYLKSLEKNIEEKKNTINKLKEGKKNSKKDQIINETQKELTELELKIQNEQCLLIDELYDYLMFVPSLSFIKDKLKKQNSIELIEIYFDRYFNNNDFNSFNINYFTIEGFNGRKEPVTLQFKDNILIFLGENGLGKTTLMKIFCYSLTDNFWKLREYNFDEIKININGEELTFNKKDIINDISTLDNNTNKKRKRNKKFELTKENIRKQLKGIKFLYLPTYRRIEYEIGNMQSIVNENSFNEEFFRFGFDDIVNIINQTCIKYYYSKKLSQKIINKQILTEEEKNKYYGWNMTLNEYNDILDKITEFVNICNEYLIHKKIVVSFDKKDEDIIYITIELENNTLKEGYNNFIHDWGKLSSGEKQIISLFCYLYLTPLTDYKIRKHFIIIDEPEMSISIHWQKHFLLDIIKSKEKGNFIGLFAVTHSPFIFYDNGLDKYAKELEDMKN